MTKLNKSFSVLVLIWLSFGLGVLAAQDFPCASNMCGNLNIQFGNPNAPTSFCEGVTIVLENNSEAGFDYYVV
ncbi:MAG: hypothetical protein AAFU67_04460, partial [Bacteroidota bacterium]